jgi:anaerobic ribonucleoside-triphosphate reductase activating protein
MRIHNRVESTRVNGPGIRACVWVQGCLLRCAGCWNPQTHDFSAGETLSVGQLAEWILSLKDIEGVTFSGGEPMHQAPAIYVLIDVLKMHRQDLSFGMFTGYSETELDKGAYKYLESGTDLPELRFDGATPTWWSMLKKRLDFVVAGRFVDTQKTTQLPMVSSLNQKLLLLSDRYRESDFKRQAVEVKIAVNGKSAKITGFPIGLKL